MYNEKPHDNARKLQSTNLKIYNFNDNLNFFFKLYKKRNQTYSK